MSRPMNVDTSGWGPFDPTNPEDVMCERERIAFTLYTLKRMRKGPKTGSDAQAIVVGGIMAIVQLAYADPAIAGADSAREALHQALDLAWLQCAGMALQAEQVN